MITSTAKYNALLYQVSGTSDALATELRDAHFLEIIHTTYSITQVFHALSVMKIDVVLLSSDVPLKVLSTLRKSYPHAAILIFCKENEEVEAELFNLVEDVLALPLRASSVSLTFSRLARFFEKEVKDSQTSSSIQEGCLKVRDGQSTYLLPIHEVRYIESLGEYMKYHTQARSYVSFGSLKRLSQSLPENYMQVHRSYIVNTKYITSFSSSNIQLVEGVNIPVGRTYKLVVKGLIL